MTVGLIAGETALRWFVYLLVFAFGVWALAVLGSIAVAIVRLARRRLGDRCPAIAPPAQVAP
jgi:hypothetical protein